MDSTHRPPVNDPRGPEPSPRRAVLARDAGLRRISKITRWLVGGALGLSGALALLAANAFHGRTVTTPAHPTTPTSTAPATTTPSTTTPSTATPDPANHIQPPTQAPTPTPATPVVVSGGS